MKTLEQHLTQYAAYHRDSRNVLTHFVGIPLIVLAVVILLSKPSFLVFGLSFTPAKIAILAAIVFYVFLDRSLGIVMAVFLQVCAWIAKPLAEHATMVWLSYGLGLFVLGWFIQFVGHYFENRKPAFVDDIMGLMIGPLFVAAELAFLCGLRKPLLNHIESATGPVVKRKGFTPAPKPQP